MRRAAVLVVTLAAVAGLGLGAALHQVADPFADPDPTGAPTSGATAGSSTASSTPAATQPPTPSPDGSTTAPSPTADPSTSADPTPTATPAFTRLALLQPSEFETHGWARADPVEEFDTLPATPIVPCTTVAPDDEGVRDGRAGTYTSDRTAAAELVVRFTDTDRAVAGYQRLRAQIAACTDATGADRVRITRSHQPELDGVAELRWWNWEPLDGGDTRGVIGIVRADDRVALLSLSSEVSDPAETTDVDGLLNQAGRRLV